MVTRHPSFSFKLAVFIAAPKTASQFRFVLGKGPTFASFLRYTLAWLSFILTAIQACHPSGDWFIGKSAKCQLLIARLVYIFVRASGRKDIII